MRPLTCWMVLCAALACTVGCTTADGPSADGDPTKDGGPGGDGDQPGRKPGPGHDPDGRPRKGGGDPPMVGVGNSGFDFECGKGTADDYVEIYPSTIIDVAEQYYLSDLGGLLTRFKTVAFDKYSMAFFIAAYDSVGGLDWADTVYDAGTGTGALGIAALSRGAHRVVGTDLDPLAVHNARYNAGEFGLEQRFEVRQVPFDDQGAWSVAQTDERFDLVICDPPQGYEAHKDRSFPDIAKPLDRPREVFYTADVGFCFLQSLVAGLDEHLTADGKCWLAMKSPVGREMLTQLAGQHGFQTRVVLDDADAKLGRGKRHLADQPGARDLSINAQMIELTRK